MTNDKKEGRPVQTDNLNEEGSTMSQTLNHINDEQTKYEVALNVNRKRILERGRK